MGHCYLCVCLVYFLPAAEGAMKARREIADYLKNKRTERARIRVRKPFMGGREKRNHFSVHSNW